MHCVVNYGHYSEDHASSVPSSDEGGKCGGWRGEHRHTVRGMTWRAPVDYVVDDIMHDSHLQRPLKLEAVQVPQLDRLVARRRGQQPHVRPVWPNSKWTCLLSKESKAWCKTELFDIKCKRWPGSDGAL